MLTLHKSVKGLLDKGREIKLQLIAMTTKQSRYQPSLHGMKTANFETHDSFLIRGALVFLTGMHYLFN